MSIERGQLYNSIDSSGATNRSDSIIKDPGLLKYERNRLETFRLWPTESPITPKELAQSGFYYTGNEDRVQCAFCHGILKGWDPGDNPHEEHKKRFAKCGFILGLNVGNVPVQTKKTTPVVTPEFSPSSGSTENLGVLSERPKHENFAIEATRVMSFQYSGTWNREKYQTPEMLAAAGFFFTGINDNVKCFFCDGGIRNWEPGDDPWTEHARFFPNCNFVRIVKGEEFVKKVHKKYNTEKGSGIYQSGISRGRRSRDSNRVDENVVNARLEWPWVRSVLQTGISRELVAQAIRDRLRDYGDDFSNAGELMDIVLTMQDTQIEIEEVSTGQNQQPEVAEAGSEASCSTQPKVYPTPPMPGDLAKENKMLRDQKTCKVCLDQEVGIVFLPCGHLCCCTTCAPAVRRCPICRTDIKGSVRTYIP